jgi:uncharacterized protein
MTHRACWKSFGRRLRARVWPIFAKSFKQQLTNDATAMNISGLFRSIDQWVMCTLFLSLPLGAPMAASAAQTFSEAILQMDTGSGVLTGSLVVPAGDEPVPVVVIIAGSGPTDRDGNNVAAGLRNDSLKLLAHGLAVQGIASVRYDKRGIGSSQAAGPSEADLRFDTYALDAALWVGELALDKRFSHVGLVGHSEGALVAMVAAQRSPASSLVAIASPALGGADILRSQLRGQLPAHLTSRSDRILSALLDGKTVSNVPAELNVLYRPSVQPYLISWFARVPTAELSRLSIPRLIVQGQNDLQIPEEQARKLKVACEACQLRIVPGMNHVLKSVGINQEAQLASYGDPDLPLSSELVPAVADFIKSARAPCVGCAPEKQKSR